MDIKRLHEAIKELRDELDRVSLAIQRIEVIAEAVVREKGQGGDPPEPEPQAIDPSEDAA